MAFNPTVHIAGESPRVFTNLSAALDYAATRARPERGVAVKDADMTTYVLLKRSPDYTITVSRQI